MTESSEAKRHFFISLTGADRPWAAWIVWTEAAGYSVRF